MVSYPNLAKFKELLDEWAGLYWDEQQKLDLRKRIQNQNEFKRCKPGRLENPPPGHFGKMFVPDNHARYPALCEWAKTAEQKWWKFGVSSDGRKGIFVPLNVWDGDAPLNLMKVGTSAASVIDNLEEENFK